LSLGARTLFPGYLVRTLFRLQAPPRRQNEISGRKLVFFRRTYDFIGGSVILFWHLGSEQSLCLGSRLLAIFLLLPVDTRVLWRLKFLRRVSPPLPVPPGGPSSVGSFAPQGEVGARTGRHSTAPLAIFFTITIFPSSFFLVEVLSTPMGNHVLASRLLRV